jgi:hypothetical protein
MRLWHTIRSSHPCTVQTSSLSLHILQEGLDEINSLKIVGWYQCVRFQFWKLSNMLSCLWYREIVGKKGQDRPRIATYEGCILQNNASSFHAPSGRWKIMYLRSSSSGAWRLRSRLRGYEPTNHKSVEFSAFRLQTTTEGGNQSFA